MMTTSTMTSSDETAPNGHGQLPKQPLLLFATPLIAGHDVYNKPIRSCRIRDLDLEASADDNPDSDDRTEASTNGREGKVVLNLFTPNRQKTALPAARTNITSPARIEQTKPHSLALEPGSAGELTSAITRSAAVNSLVGPSLTFSNGALEPAGQYSQYCSDNVGRARGGSSHVRRAIDGLRRIENQASRQVTFSKRRNGLLKKAFELSVLCDVELAVVAFSSTGRVSEFASPSMAKVIERYEEATAAMSNRLTKRKEIEYWKREAILLREQIHRLHEMQGYLTGDNIAHLPLQDLNQLEWRLNLAVSRVKARKLQLIQAQVKEQHKDRILDEENGFVKDKIVEAMPSLASKDQRRFNNHAFGVEPAVGGTSKDICPISLTLRL